MKSLNCLSCIQRARLLHQLFPQVIPFFLRYLKASCEENPPIPTGTWEENGYSNNELAEQVRLTKEIFEKEDFHLETRRKAFSETLFLHPTVDFVMDRLVNFALDKEFCQNLKFRMQVQIFFVGESALFIDEYEGKEDEGEYLPF